MDYLTRTLVRVHSNQTILRGRVKAIRPERDDRGAEIDLEVLSNETISPKEDFLRPVEGDTLTAFLAEAPRVKVGDHVRAFATLQAGPTGQRTVLRSLELIKP